MLLVTMLVAATPTAYGQRDVYITPEGRVYSKKQWDSLWYASGDWVEFVRRRRSSDTVYIALVPRRKADFIQDICKDGRCDKVVYENRPENPAAGPFFSRVAAVKVTSFKNPPEARYGREIPRINNMVDVNRMFEVKTLDAEMRDLVVKVLRYYNLDTMESNSASCYEPRNAILFMDSRDAIIGHVELCFGCQRGRAEPMVFDSEEFFAEQWEALRRIFMMAGIKYGTDPNERN
jgi:hypothetical protein